MFWRLGTFWIVCGISVGVGYFLIVAMDFLSQISFISGVSDLVWELSYLGHFLVVILSFLIVIMPIDFYFMIWGTSLSTDPSLLISLELLLFFGLMGAMIGFRSKSVRGAFIGGYLFITMMNIIVFILILLLTPVFLGSILAGVLQGLSGRDMTLFYITSIAENGTIVAFFSSFIATLLGRGEKGAILPELCLDQNVCPI